MISEGRFTSAELFQWPLVHGTIFLYENIDAIIDEGLSTTNEKNKMFNSFWYDKILNRHKYVFLAPPRISGGYGLGSFLIIDPSILKKPGVICFLHDIDLLIKQIGYSLDNLSQTLPDWIIDPTYLKNLINNCQKLVEKELLSSNCPSGILEMAIIDNTKKRVVQSEEFIKYVKRYYLTPKDFYDRITSYCISMGYSIKDYLKRDSSFSEEVLIPDRIDSGYIIGYFLNNKWVKCNSGSSNNIEKRVIDFISLYNENLVRMK